MTQASYGYDAIEMMRRRGVLRLEIWCTGIQSNGNVCTNRYTVSIETLIERLGPATPLVMVARKCRCRACGHIGAHVQPEPPPSPAGPGAKDYPAWLRGELERCASFLKEHGWF